ncbi:MAG: amino acid permease, partial [bacterium]
GGAIALAGALAFAELATSFPEAGGPYVYLREAFGPFVAFLYGWMATLLVSPGATAVLALGGANHLGLPMPGLWAAAAVIILGAISAFGVRAGAAVQSGLNGAKLLAMGGLLLAGFLWGRGDWGHFVTAVSTAGGQEAAPTTAAGVTLGGFALALIPITFTYSGWNAPMFVGGEIVNPARTIPRAVLFGTLLVVGVYLAINVLYLYALPVGSLGAEKAAARAAAGALLGPRAAEAVGWLVGLSVFGCMANGIVTGPRVPYAMAKDGLLPAWLAEVHPRWQTPVAAIALQTALAVAALAWAKTIDRLLDLVTVPGMVLTALAVVGLFRLRKLRPDAVRPYTAWGSPWVPVFFVG